MKARSNMTHPSIRSFLRAAVALGMLTLSGTALAAEGIHVEQAWARPTTSMAKAGGAFLTIHDRAGQGDRLVGASSPAAERAELHSHTMEDGIARMREVEGGIEVSAGGELAMQPGGYHIMLMGLRAPLAPGGTVPLTLSFERAGDVDVTVRVLEAGERPPAAGGMQGDGHGQAGGHRH